MEHDAAYLFGPFRLHPAKRLLLNGETHLSVGSRAFDLLVQLVSNAGEVMSARTLVERVWPDSVVDPASLRVHISSLRKILGKVDGADYVQNVPLRGYCFVAKVRRVSNQQEAEAAALTAPSQPVAAPTAFVPPHAPALLLGRTSTVEEVRGKLERWRCVTLVGPGGIGKTSVALSLSSNLPERYTDGMVYLDLAPVADAAHLPSTLATQLGIPIDARDPMGTIYKRFADRRLLLVVDNCEHLIDTIASFIENVLSHCAHLQILATSREPLRISGETVVRLPPLPLPPADIEHTPDARNYPAVQLFALRASQSHGDFVLSDDNVPLVAEICRRLDGIPLAIELAAANAATFSLQQIADHLDQRLSLLVYGRRTALPRHQTLRATMDWSFKLLSPAEQELLARLSLFRSWFSLEAATAIGLPNAAEAGADGTGLTTFAECLHGLISKSMLTMDIVEETVQYRLLESTRRYAREQLLARRQLNETAERHARFLVGALDLPAAQRDGQPPTFWVENYGRYLDDLRTALAWAFGSDGVPALAIQLVAESAPLWFARTLMAEFLGYAERAAELHDRGVEIPHLSELRLYESLGHAIWHVRGDIPRMTDAFNRSAELARQMDLQSHQLRAALGSWLGAVTAADYAGARRLAERFGELMPSSRPSDLEVLHSRMMTLGLHLAGDHAAATAHGVRVLQHPTTISSTSTNTGIQFDQHVASQAVLARIHWVRGEVDAARECARQATERSRDLGHAISTCFAIAFGAGPVAAWCGDFATLREQAEVLVEAASRQSLRLWLNFGHAYRLAASTQDGRRAWDAGAMAELAGYANTSGLLQHNLFTFSPCFVSSKVLNESEPDLDSWCGPELLRLHALRRWQQGPQTAERAEPLLPMLQQSIMLARRQHALSWELRSATTLAELLQALGRFSEARDQLTTVLDRLSEGADTADARSAYARLAGLRQGAASASSAPSLMSSGRKAGMLSTHQG